MVCTGQFNEAKSDASHALEFLKGMYSDDLDGYDGDSVQYIVAVLRERYPHHNVSSSSAAAAVAARLPNQRRRNASAQTDRDNNNKNNNNNHHNNGALFPSSFSVTSADAGRSRHSVATATPDVARGDSVRDLFDPAHVVVDEYANVGWTTVALGGAIPTNSSGTETKSNNRSAVPPPSYFENDSYAERLLEIAHIFHFVSIAILGIFVIQVRTRARDHQSRWENTPEHGACSCLHCTALANIIPTMGRRCSRVEDRAKVTINDLHKILH